MKINKNTVRLLRKEGTDMCTVLHRRKLFDSNFEKDSNLKSNNRKNIVLE